MAMHTSVVLGTARKGRKSERVLTALLNEFKKVTAVSVEGVDVRDHVSLPETIPNWGVGGANEQPTTWKEIVLRTDAFVFILPEYNHSFPGEWKLLVDSLFNEYKGKTAYIVGVSAGSFSGVRVADHVKPVLTELNFVVEKTGLYVGAIEKNVAEDGTVLDEGLADRITKFVAAVTESAV